MAASLPVPVSFRCNAPWFRPVNEYPSYQQCLIVMQTSVHSLYLQ